MAYPPPPYKDAVTGTPVTGEAITGAWWVYPSAPGLKLGGEPPEVTALSGNIAPPAGLKLGAYAPALRISPAPLVVPAAGLALGAILPTFRTSTTLSPPPAGLALGAYVAVFVGSKRMTPLDCLDLDLVAAPERVLVLAASVPSDLDLDPLECL